MGHRCGSDPKLLWLWYRPAATAPVGPLAWEIPCAAGVAIEKTKKRKKERKKKKDCTAGWRREGTEELACRPSGSAVTLHSAQQKPARKGLWLCGGSQCPHASKGHRLINLFNHKLRVEHHGPGFTYEPPSLPIFAGELNQED